MKRKGHHGFSLFLSSPIVLTLLLFDYTIPAVLFLGIVGLFSSASDTDTGLSIITEEDERLDPDDLRPELVPAILVAILAEKLMVISGRFMDRVPSSTPPGFNVNHRGITHTIWFGVAVGLVLLPVAFVCHWLLFYTFFPPSVTEMARESGWLLPHVLVTVFLAGIANVVFHCAGDVVTPMGINLLTNETDDGTTLDLFNYDNGIANSSFLVLGYSSVTVAIYLGVFNSSLGFTVLWSLVGGWVLAFLLGMAYNRRNSKAHSHETTTSRSTQMADDTTQDTSGLSDSVPELKIFSVAAESPTTVSTLSNKWEVSWDEVHRLAEEELEEFMEIDEKSGVRATDKAEQYLLNQNRSRIADIAEDSPTTVGNLQDEWGLTWHETCDILECLSPYAEVDEKSCVRATPKAEQIEEKQTDDEDSDNLDDPGWNPISERISDR